MMSSVGDVQLSVGK